MAKKKGGKKPNPNLKTVVRNRRARYEFVILEQYEAGMVLVGTEVKSLRDGNASLEESYLRFQKGELWWIKGNIMEFKHSGSFLNHEARRKRKLLLRKSQLRKLAAQLGQKGFTLVPLDIHITPRGLLKMEIGLCRGKKLHDKRQSEKSRQDRREIGSY
jgi:SsrA-binding protein